MGAATLDAGSKTHQSGNVGRMFVPFSEKRTSFLRRFVTTDETWVHYYTPETKKQSKQWKHVDSPPPKKAKAIRSAGKVMTSVFWDTKGILLIGYLPIDQTIMG